MRVMPSCGTLGLEGPSELPLPDSRDVGGSGVGRFQARRGSFPHSPPLPAALRGPERAAEGTVRASGCPAGLPLPTRGTGLCE
ncbi:hypothetical protein VULLAG_LOCUS11783 [Vulpes lagopus]